jgi:flagellar hook assembly protein FlgD
VRDAGRILTLTGAVLSAASIAVLAGSASVFINYPSISPNGDGIQDEMIVGVNLSSPVDTLLVTIEDHVSPAVYDTLIRSVPADAGDLAAGWDGTDWTGTPLPEETYRLRVYESTGGIGESIVRTVVIDTTFPQVDVDRIEPGVFSPGYPDESARVTAYFTVTGWEDGASARMTVRNPSGIETTQPVEVLGDGEWTGEWSPATAESGFHVISIIVDDEAGNFNADSGSVFVDSDGPELEFITAIPTATPEVPREIIGTAYDLSGVSVLELEWTGTDEVKIGPFPPDSTWFSADTLYWRFDTPDTVSGDAGYYEEGGYKLRARAEDPFENGATNQVSFKLDRTPPSAPVIQDPPGRIIQPGLELDISYDEDTDSLYVYILGGGSIDSIMYITAGGEPIKVNLSEGQNEIWAFAYDNAGNRSGISNTVSTNLDPSVGITYPEVFRGPGSFQVVSSGTVASVTVEIYDIRGERIRRFHAPGPGVSFDIEWDLTSDDGEDVRNGPCLVVITVDGSGGRTVEKGFIAVVR